MYIAQLQHLVCLSIHIGKYLYRAKQLHHNQERIIPAKNEGYTKK